MQNSTRVDFYILAQADPIAWLTFACRLTDKAYSLGNEVYAHTASTATARQFDELLWTFKADSFVPHELLEGADVNAPVRIGTQEHVQESGELLVNLSAELPAFSGNYSRIAEVVAGDNAALSLGRERYQYYKSVGLTPAIHNIGQPDD